MEQLQRGLGVMNASQPGQQRSQMQKQRDSQSHVHQTAAERAAMVSQLRVSRRVAHLKKTRRQRLAVQRGRTGAQTTRAAAPVWGKGAGMVVGFRRQSQKVENDLLPPVQNRHDGSRERAKLLPGKSSAAAAAVRAQPQ